jgi:hypothetical protein
MLTRRSALSLLATSLLTSSIMGGQVARAECAVVDFVLAEDPSEQLPPDPVIHLFVYSGQAHDERTPLRVLSNEGHPLAVELKRVDVAAGGGRTPVAVYQARLRTGSARAFVVYLRGERPVEFKIDPRWRGVAGAPVQITQIGVSTGAVCPQELTRDLGLSVKAAAYIVEWAKSEDDYRSGKRQRRWLPFQLPLAESFGVIDEEAAPVQPAGRLQLGEPACLGRNFVWPSGRPVYVGVVAILPDGSQTPLPQQPTRVAAPE